MFIWILPSANLSVLKKWKRRLLNTRRKVQQISCWSPLCADDQHHWISVELQSICQPYFKHRNVIMTAESLPLKQAPFVFLDVWIIPTNLWWENKKPQRQKCSSRIISSLWQAECIHGDALQAAASPLGWTEAPHLRMMRVISTVALTAKCFMWDFQVISAAAPGTILPG